MGITGCEFSVKIPCYLSQPNFTSLKLIDEIWDSKSDNLLKY